MPIFITEKETDLEALASSLARTPRAAAAVRTRVLALNPHLADAARIPKGAVLMRLTSRWSGRVRDKVPSPYDDVRAAQLNR